MQKIRLFGILSVVSVLVACQSTTIGETITPYQCGKYQIDANYPEDIVTAHVDEDVYTLDRVESGLGIKFENKTGRDEDAPIVVFWTKGQDTQLFLDEKPGIVCKQTSK